jgi:carboxyl-terminal processing protease
LELLPHFPQGHVSFAGIGIFTKSVDGDWFVTGVVDDGPAAAAGLRRGQHLISVDGQPFHPIQSFLGKVGREVSIEVQDSTEPSSRHSISVTPIEIEPQAFMQSAMEKSMRIIESSGKRIGYVRIWSYAGPQFQDRLIDAVTSGPAPSRPTRDYRFAGWLGRGGPEYLQLFNRQIPLDID